MRQSRSLPSSIRFCPSIPKRIRAVSSRAGSNPRSVRAHRCPARGRHWPIPPAVRADALGHVPTEGLLRVAEHESPLATNRHTKKKTYARNYENTHVAAPIAG